MSTRVALPVAIGAVALFLLAACEPTKPVRGPESDAPFPPADQQSGRRPPSGTCNSDLDCKANGMECLHEREGKAGTCVRMDPAMGPNGLPGGPCLGGHC